MPTQCGPAAPKGEGTHARPARGWWDESPRPSGGALRLHGNITEVLCRCCYCVACAILVTRCCLQRHLIAASAAASGSAALNGPLPRGSRGPPAPQPVAFGTDAEDPCQGRGWALSVADTKATGCPRHEATRPGPAQVTTLKSPRRRPQPPARHRHTAGPPLPQRSSPSRTG